MEGFQAIAFPGMEGYIRSIMTRLQYQVPFRLPESIWKDYPLTDESGRPEILYCEHFRGGRSNRAMSWHDHWEITAVIDGEGELILGAGGSIPMAPETLLLIPPGHEHYEESPGRMDLIWLGFRAGLMPEHACDIHAVRSARLADMAVNFWKFLLPNPTRCGLELEGRLLMLLGALLRLTRHPETAAGGTLTPALDYLQSHPTATVQVQELAAMCRISKSHFFREFRKATGMTPVEYQQKLKLELALLYLRETDLSGVEIARMCGFSDQFYFSRVFRQRFGCPPQQFRQRMLRR